MSLASGVGLISGLNIGDIITQLSQVNKRPAALLVRRQTAFTDRKNALQKINESLLSLKDAVASISSEKNFERRLASVTKVGDSEIAKASVTDEAAIGSFSFEVVQLAKNHRIAATGITDANETGIASADGVFSFRIGSSGKLQTINVSSATTLNQLRDAINALDGGGATATVLDDGSGTNAFRFLLSSDKSGLANDIQIVTNDTDLIFSDTQTAQDAIVKIDSIQITRESNEISDVIKGVTLTALKVDTTAVTVTVTNDNVNVKGPIKNFVGAYNKLIDKIDEATIFDLENNVKGPLFGDSTVRLIRSRLSNILSSSIAGLGDDNSVGAIGIDIQSDGKLVVDDSKLDKAVADNFENIKKILALIGTTTSSGVLFNSVTESTISGTYGVNVTAAAEKATLSGAQAVDVGGITNAELLTFTFGSKTESITISAGSTLDSAISTLKTFFEDKGFNLEATNESGILQIDTGGYGSGESFTLVSDQSGAVSTQLGIGTTILSDTGVDVAGTIDGKAATGSAQFLTGAVGSAVEGLKLQITSATPISSSVTVTRGIADRIEFALDGITDSSDGLIKTKTASLDASIKELGKRIETLSARVLRQEDLLRKRFVSLESQLFLIQQQGNFLLSQLASISGF